MPEPHQRCPPMLRGNSQCHSGFFRPPNSGPGGRRFKSSRPDQSKLSPAFKNLPAYPFDTFELGLIRSCCNRLWLLKNSHSRSSQKFHRARMPYKRRSRFWWTFSTPRLGQFFQERGFFNSHACLHQPFCPSVASVFSSARSELSAIGSMMHCSAMHSNVPSRK